MQDARQISGETHFVCLLGNPTGHSLSPAMHNLSFRLLGIDAVYTCFDVRNDDLPHIVQAFKAMQGWDGFNLTMPCKHAIMPLLDGLDDAAALIGAVNVVKKTEAGAWGYNTDGVGFMQSLCRNGVDAKGAHMVLLGPGGAGSAILVQAALDGVARIDAFARAGGTSYVAAQDLARRVGEKTGCRVEIRDLGDSDDVAACIGAADILVNATPIGMGEGCTDTPVPVRLLRPNLVVADVIYHPRKTQLINDALACGCTVVPGLGMLIGQAAAGEAIWYGVQMPVAQIEQELFAGDGA